MSNSPLSRPAHSRDRHLSLGVTLPIREVEGPAVDFMQQVEFATAAERLGFSAVWVRDVPLNGPWYPEAFGHPDPIAMLGAIAARTSRIALGTAATVLTLRHPLHIAKAAISLDHLSHGRFVLGLGSGDRREEFAAFGTDPKNHKEVYRCHWTQLAAALERPPRIALSWPIHQRLLNFAPQPRPTFQSWQSAPAARWIARNAGQRITARLGFSATVICFGGARSAEPSPANSEASL
jgi:luciferase-type oxidoreductase